METILNTGNNGLLSHLCFPIITIPMKLVPYSIRESESSIYVISSYWSFHSGFPFSINSIFHFLFHSLMRFSL